MTAPDLTRRLTALLSAPGAGLLLDLDGTLVDSEPTHRAAYRRYFAARGWDVPDDVVRRFAGRRGAEVFAALEGPWTGEDPDGLARDVIARLDVLADPPAPVPGAADAVRAWHRRGVGVAVVTSATRPWAEEALALIGLADVVLEMVTAELTPVGKPDPAPYVRGALALGVAPEACVAAEDTPAGLAAAAGAGVGFRLGVATSHAAGELEAAGAHAVAADLTALVPTV